MKLHFLLLSIPLLTARFLAPKCVESARIDGREE
jgi:hypothetical protein